MFYAIYTECKGPFAMHPGSIAAVLKAKNSCSKENLGKDLVSSVVQESSGTNDLVDYFVFEDENHALHFMENFPIAYKKIFTNIKEARAFVILGPEFMPSEQEEQSIDFFEPTYGDLNSLRNYIKAGEYENVKSMIRDNPKTLISFGGIPTNLLSSYNYNAVHICAYYNQPKIVELILHTLCNRRFTNLYLGRMNVTSNTELSKNFLEVFLNTPDNIQGETPLHIAAKFGHVEVVKVLTLFTACKSLTNFDGHLPVDIICKFDKDSTEDVSRCIKQLLMECYQAPVLCTTNDTGDNRYSETEENESPGKAVPLFNHRKQLSRLSFGLPSSPSEPREKSIKVRRSLFSLKSDDKNCNESSDQVPDEANAEVKQHNGGVNLEKIKLSSTPLEHSNDDSPSFDIMPSPMLYKHEISFSSTPLNLSSDPFNISSASLAVNVSCANPWKCIESSLQENINLIAMLIIRQLQNISSSNSVLLFEMKRLEAAVLNFQRDEHFSKVAFEKIHSRIGSLLATAMEKSEYIIDIKANIENNIFEVFTQSLGLQWGFNKCICTHLLKKLSEPPKTHPNSIKNENFCAIVMWMEEESCCCQWQDGTYNVPELSAESFPELKNIRNILNENFKKLIILDNESTKNGIQVVDEKQAVREDDHQEVSGDMKNIPVKEEAEMLSETLIDSAKADALLRAIATSPITIEVSIQSKPTSPKTPIIDKIFTKSTPYMCQQNLECDEKDNSLKEKTNVCPITTEVTFTTPVSKQPGLFSKYREKKESDFEETILATDTSQLSDSSN